MTIRDVARRSGVSPMTVSRVINDSERVSPSTRSRVERAIEELGYVPSRLARGLSRQKTGALVSGKPTKTKLPPPFDQVPSVGLGHQIHHKFVVCGFNGKNPVVFCGSSNLAEMGEEVNGDNLIAIHDTDIATVFAIEALTLVDHFDFLDRSSTVAKQTPAKIKAASKQEQADKAQWFLSTSDHWVQPYFDKNDLRCVDRELFG